MLEVEIGFPRFSGEIKPLITNNLENKKRKPAICIINC